MLSDRSEIYYGIDGERYGPVSFDELCALLESGRLRAKDYIWMDGEDDWVALAEVEELRRFLPPPHGGTEAPAEDRLNFAGFWIRLAAHIIDSLVLTPPSMLWIYAAASISGLDPATLDTTVLMNDPFSSDHGAATAAILQFQLLFYAGFAVIDWLYRATAESSSWQATIGKRAFGLVVTDLSGRRLSFAMASLRHWSKLLSQLPLNLGFLIIAFHRRKQGLHDIIAGSYVLQR